MAESLEAKIIADAESVGVRVFTQDVMSYLAANVWAGFGSVLLGPVVGFIVGYIVSVGMQRLDWLTYMLVENWQTTEEGKKYAAAAENLAGLSITANADEIRAAEQAKVDAFRALIGLGSAPN